MENIHDVANKEFLALWDVSQAKYKKTVEKIQKKLSVIRERKSCEVNIGPYNTVIFLLLKGNMNIHYVTGAYVMIVILTSYL